MYAHATFQRVTRNAAASTADCRKKWTSAAPMLASGRISRGNDTFLIRPAFPTTAPVAAPSPAENRFHTSRPDSRNSGKAGMPGAEDQVEGDVEDDEVEQRVHAATTRSPSALFLYRTFSSVRTIATRSSR